MPHNPLPHAPQTQGLQSFNAVDLRSALGKFMTGVVVVTTRTADGQPVGFTANSFTSVSLDPPLILVCPGKTLSSYQCFANCSWFAISILSAQQEAVSNTFASKSIDRFSQVAWSQDANRVPLIDGALAHLSCRTSQVIEAGDHCILLGQVTEISAMDGSGLGFHNGRYFTLPEPEQPVKRRA